MKQGQGRWTRLLRRGTALFLTTVTVWVLSLTADMGAAAETFRTLAESPAFVSAALRAELGSLPEEEGESLTFWERLALGQSPTLSAGVGREAADVPEVPSPSPSAGEPDDPEDPEELPAVTAAPEDIVGRTLLPVSGDGYDSAQGVYIENRPGLELDVAAMAQAELALDLPEEGPQVLIVHTHGSEAYTPDRYDQYEESDSYRTEDLNYNVVRVGDELAAALEAQGLSVLHDREIYDYPSYTGSYSRSGAAVEEYLAQYPDIAVVIDLHRDALGDGDVTYKTMAELDGQTSSQLMMLVGTGEGGLSHPNWEQNLRLALYLQQAVNAKYPTLARPISVTQERYNQQLTTGSMILEVGSSGNTLQEALTAVRLYADAVGPALLKLVAEN